jgi:hypothetical protein
LGDASRFAFHARARPFPPDHPGPFRLQHPRANGDADLYRHGNRYADRDGYQHAHANVNRDGHAHANRYSDGHAHANRHADGYAHADRDAIADADADPAAAGDLDADAGLCASHGNTCARITRTTGARYAARERHVGCEPDL